MSPAVGDFRSSSSSSAQPSSFQNPNPKYPTDSGILHTSFNPINFNFDCSKDAAPTPTVRSSRRKHAKVKKVSSFSASVSSKHVNSTGNTINFVFNASNKVSDCNPSLGKTVSSGNGEQQSIGESLDFSKFQFTMGSTNNAKNMDPEEAQNSGIGNGFQSLNFAFSADEKVDARNVTERGAEKAGKLNGLEFVFGASMNNGVNSFTSEADSLLAKSLSGLNLGTGESGDVAPLMNDNSKTQENTTSDSKSSVNLDSVFSADHRDIKTDVNYEKEESKETVEKLVSDGKVEINGLFHIGTQNKKRSNCKGRRKVNKQMNNLKKQENNVDSVRDGNYSFVFGSKLGNAFSDTPQSKVPDELKTSNNTLNNDSCSYFNNSFVFGSDKKQNKPINQNEKTEAEVIKETAPCSTNEAGTTNNFNFSSTNGVFGTSFTGFNTPDINLTSYFTSDMLTGLGKKLEFSKSNSVRPRKLRKAKAVLTQQGRNRQQPFEEASGCSPMDFSPYGGAECVSTSTNPANVSSSSTTSFAGTNLSAKQRPRKKYITKTGQGLKFTTPKVSRAHESTSGNHTKASDHEICDRWRKRGNEAYKNGDLSEAEGCYSKGISSIQHIETAGFCIEPLLLCYSNRAAARMALGRLREGLKDCRIAASLDPTFVKANLRSANCHLLLGELEDASYNYNKCLEFENIACLDRRLAIEAADGVQKAQKVANYVKQSAELLQQKTDESATNALRIIIDALSLSCYSEKLLNMKGEALFVLGKHKDVVQLCEQTLDSAEKNFATESKLWRWNLMSKSYFHLGRLEIALDFIEKHEQLRSTADKSTVDPKESLNPLAVTIRELLHCKNAGNEAFQNGKHTEAIEHYSTAISKSMESHSFAAVCFCNRAAAHQSLGEIIDAIGDCSTSIALDETYPKAFSRRSTLWEMIRDYKHAADDLQRFISILERRPCENSQKSNGSVKDLRRARRRLSSIEENSKKERGIKPSDAAAEVKKAYRKAALRHHPDKAGQVIARAESGSDGQKWKVITESIQMDADKLFKMIGEAYAVLSDSTKRSKYDLEEEMWDDMNTHACSSSSRRASDFYNSTFETTNRRDSHYSTRTYGNSHHHYWGDSRKNYQNSYPRW